MRVNFKHYIFYISLFVSVLSVAQSRNQAYLSYIEQYYQIAEKQQKEHRIPASIVLAQGLLESGAGQSDFAKQSNNHFGIKCTDWTGEKIYHDDDKKGECFRKYDHVIDSYEDHALFLKSRPRYAFLFDLNPTDYKGWAYGLKKAGYATDPTYAIKLISIIENYDLHRFDLNPDSNSAIIIDKSNFDSNPKADENQRSMGLIDAGTKHQIMKVNKVEFITSYSGDSYAGIADEFHLTENRLREYNEVDSNAELAVGTRVFIESKKNKAPKECKSHVVLEGESMYSISQDYGVKVENLYHLNKMPFSQGAIIGQTLKLR